MTEPLLRVEDLRTYFDTPAGTARAVDGVSFSIAPGETLALVGESGCGKSMTALSILQLVPEPAGYIAGGHVYFQGVDLLDYTWEEMRRVRGADIGMIFQEPMTSLNPVFTIGWQLMEAMAVHGKGRGPDTRRRAVELLTRVGLPEPERLLRQYPHELSGGMRQRVMIAMALANNPKLLIADEPTTALDVTVQKQILELIRELQQDFGMAVLLITHDLGIVAEVSDTVAVMYAGQIVEYATTRDLFRAPAHPYTRALFASRPSRDQRGRDLITIEGIVPQATAWPPACRFAPRCPERWPACENVAPVYQKLASPGEDQTGPAERGVRCHLYHPELARTRPEQPATLEVHP
ncbi:MAG: ABC transporter ATP-binding protein [Chloroherpetonaceae bacterium]|nr:ABC transporter ATP-binding protein [Chthonomonadaceae bacterium]MDW8208564.1 ABC transporter ATP-binding protein [Chloroherpetonaceae bacterium]